MKKTHPSEKKDHPGLVGETIRFAGFLKNHGFRVFQSSVEDAIRCLEIMGLFNRTDFLSSLRSNLCTNELEWSQFSNLFNEFWSMEAFDAKNLPRENHSEDKEIKDEQTDEELLYETGQQESAPVEDPDEKEWLEQITYSPISRVEKKDLADFEKGDIQVAQLALKKLVEPFKINVSRRSKRSQRVGSMDFPRVIKQSLRTGGIPFKLFYREKKRRLKRLVILADVSGSMDRYARFVMPFLLGLRGVGSKAEVFVFSTSLSSISFLIRRLNYDEILDHIASSVPDWSGGTRIGFSLHQFNQGPGQRLLNRRTVVLILSDGWDLGGKELLKREMEMLRRKAYCVVWLNPLAGDPGYEPVCGGMKVALPYVDHFVPVSNLQSLKRVGRIISRVMVH